MSTAYELLSSMTNEDKTIVIDNDLRTINIPSTLKNIGVEKDDEVLILNFKMPATYCGFDLSVFQIRINYLNGIGEEDIYEVDDASVVGEYIFFSWLVGRHATLYKGNVSFGVTLKKLDSKGNPLKRFNTAPATLPVLQGLDTSEKAISEYNDIFEQWRAKLFGVGDTEEARIIAVSEDQQRAIENKGASTLATIPGDYTETHNLAKEAHRTKADAIVIETEGDKIFINDSSDDNMRRLNVYGKTNQTITTGAQLINMVSTDPVSVNGITWKCIDGVVYASGTSTGVSSSGNAAECDITGLVGTYFISGNNGGINVYVAVTKNGETDWYSNQAFTLDGTETKVLIYCQGSAGTTVDSKVYPMFNEGSEPLPWEPYSGGEPGPNPIYPQPIHSIDNTKISIYGKNLLRETAIPLTSSQNGITCEYEGDGVFHIYGTNTCDTSESQLAGTNVYIPVDPDSKYTISVEILEGTLPSKFHVFLGLGSDTVSFTNWFSVAINSDNAVGSVVSDFRTPSKTLNDPKQITRFWIYNYNGDNQLYDADFRLKVWVEKGDMSTSYSPFTEQVLQPPHSLYAIPVQSNGNYVDENGQQWVCDEVDFERGVFIQRCYKESLSFAPQSELNRYRATLRYPANTKYAVDNGIPLVCDKHIFTPLAGASTPQVNGIRIAATSPSNCIAYHNGEVIDTATVLYPLATPIETALSDAELQKFKMVCTNQHSTTIVNDKEAWMKVEYNADTQDFIKTYVAAEISKYLGGDGV